MRITYGNQGGVGAMKGIEVGKDKVKKICDLLRKETLEPAKEEAEQIVEAARNQAQKMILDAKKEVEKMKNEASADITRQRNVFQSSLHQACKQALEGLRQEIEGKLFNQSLSKVLAGYTQDPKIVAELIEAIMKAIEKEGLDTDISVYVSSSVPPRSVNALLMQDVLKNMKEKSVLVGPITGGAQVKLHKENITIDVSDVAIKEMVSKYIRKDFHEMLFGSH